MSRRSPRRGQPRRLRRLDPGARRQMPLALPVDASYVPEDFVESEESAAALSLIRHWPDWPGPAVLLHGPAGAGKSHLAAIHRRHAAARALDPASIDPDQPGDPAARLPRQAALIVDPLEPWVGTLATEEALVHLLNVLAQREATLLLCARQPAGHLTCRLADLSSRLRALPAVAIAAPGDDLRAAIAVKIFSDFQLAPQPDALALLLSAGPRDVAHLHSLIGRLNDLALTRRMRTVSLEDVRDVLETGVRDRRGA